MSSPVLALSDTIIVAIISVVGIGITAVVGPILIALLNHVLGIRNEERKKSIETIESMATQLKDLEKEVERLKSRNTGRGRQ
jgi:ABC-type bacteriocin/lantibiotic exporter with double-glycine peptidase domain